MKDNELLKCIMTINPNARCVVWQGGKVVYDPSHKGKKPTIEECEAVLSQVQAGISVEENRLSAKENEKKNNPMADLTFEQAETWIDTNVTDLTSAKEAMKKIIRLILAIK